MPTYEYVCSKCDQHLEVYQSFSEEPLKRHAGCGGKLSKVLGSVGIVLKGSGFYRTDNASSSRRKAERSESSSSTSDTKSVGTPSRIRRPPPKSDTQAGGEVRQEERHQEVGLARPGGDGRPRGGVTATPTPPPGATTEPGDSHAPSLSAYRARLGGRGRRRRRHRHHRRSASSRRSATRTRRTARCIPSPSPATTSPSAPASTPADLTRRRIRGEAPEADALTEAQAVGRVVRVPLLRGAHRDRASPRRHSTSGTRRRRARRATRGAARGRARAATDRRRPRRRARHLRSRDDRRRVTRRSWSRPPSPVVAVDTEADAGDTVAVTVLVDAAPVDPSRLRRPRPARSASRWRHRSRRRVAG